MYSPEIRLLGLVDISSYFGSGLPLVSFVFPIAYLICDYKSSSLEVVLWLVIHKIDGGRICINWSGQKIVLTAFLYLW